jgi:hypothetical protein
MAATQRIRLSPLDLDVGHDEELPGYEALTAPAPAYDSGAYDEPLITYQLRQYDRKIQVLGAYSTAATSSYRITTNSFRLFSKKPEIELLYTSPEMRQRVVASISYDNDGPLPWRPRAHFDHNASDGLDTRYEMESRNFTDWTFQVRDRTYAWRLQLRPVSLVLCAVGSGIAIARFTYSAKGALAVRGAEIGELRVYRDGLTMQQDGIDKLVCGLMVVLTFMKKMGRYYRNEMSQQERADSVTRELSPLHMASLAGAPTF